MNLLAHAVLSPRPGLVRVGNLATDFMQRPDEARLVGELREGVELHKRIDTFTDRHEIVERAIKRLVGYQRFANPIVDVIFDHFLVQNWPLATGVGEFVKELHEELDGTLHHLPEETGTILRRMMEDQWLLSYGDFDGLRLTFQRMERRVLYRANRTVDMAGAVAILEREYRHFENDFLEFWPDLVQSVNTE